MCRISTYQNKIFTNIIMTYRTVKRTVRKPVKKTKKKRERKIHTGKSGGRYYMHRGRKMYIHRFMFDKKK